MIGTLIDGVMYRVIMWSMNLQLTTTKYSVSFKIPATLVLNWWMNSFIEEKCTFIFISKFLHIVCESECQHLGCLFPSCKVDRSYQYLYKTDQCIGIDIKTWQHWIFCWNSHSFRGYPVSELVSNQTLLMIIDLVNKDLIRIPINS